MGIASGDRLARSALSTPSAGPTLGPLAGGSLFDGSYFHGSYFANRCGMGPFSGVLLSGRIYRGK